MRLIDADKFLEYLIFSKHIDSLKCKEIKEAVEMCKVEVLEQIRAEIEETIESYVCDKEENTMKAQGMLNAMQMTFEIIDKYKGDKV